MVSVPDFPWELELPPSACPCDAQEQTFWACLIVRAWDMGSQMANCRSETLALGGSESQGLCDISGHGTPAPIMPVCLNSGILDVRACFYSGCYLEEAYNPSYCLLPESVNTAEGF